MTNRIAPLRQFLVRLVIFGTVLASAPVWAGWRATGPFGGDAEVIRTVPKVRDLVIAGARNGLLYTSTNGGAAWNNIRFPAQFGAVLHALEVDPRSASTWFAGTESDSAWLSGVYKTDDAGKTWTLLPQTRGSAVWSLAVFPRDPSVMAAGTGNGVYLSRDAGQSWKHISPENDAEIRPVVSLAFDPQSSDVLYAGTTHLPWRTSDGGASWHSIHEGMIDDSDVFSIQVDPGRPERIFASACSGVYGSVNGAARWARLETPKGAFRTHFVAIDPGNSLTVFAGTTEGLLRSPDGGRTWRNVNPQSIKSIAFDPFIPGRIFFASTTAGLMVSTDAGITLREINFGFANRNFTMLAGAGYDLYSSSVYEAQSGGVYRSNNYGLRWVRIAAVPDDQMLLLSAVPDDPQAVFGAGYHSLLESTDNGKTWQARKSPAGTRISAILALSRKEVLVATNQGLFRATDAAAWVQCAIGEVVPLRGTQRKVSPGDTERFSAQQISALRGTGKKTLSALTAHGAFASADGGATWKTCGQPAAGVEWYSMDFDLAPAADALAATSSGLFRSADSCGTWTPVRQGLRPETASLVIFHPTHPGEAFVSQGGHVFRSTDGGQSWRPLDDDAQGNSGPSSLVVLPAAPDLLFALFPRRGVFSTSIKEKPLQ